MNRQQAESWKVRRIGRKAEGRSGAVAVESGEGTMDDVDG